jgi:hypothetical protein
MYEDDGAAIIAQSRECPADARPDRRRRAHTFKVWIHNGSTRALQIRLQSFVRTAVDGRTIAPSRCFRAAARAVNDDAAFEHTTFAGAPCLAARAIPSCRHATPAFLEPIYSARGYDSAVALAIPPAAVRRRVAPGQLAISLRISLRILNWLSVSRSSPASRPHRRTHCSVAEGRDARGGSRRPRDETGAPSQPCCSDRAGTRSGRESDASPGNKSACGLAVHAQVLRHDGTAQLHDPLVE